MIRVAEFLLTLGLGASLVIVAPRVWTLPAPAPVKVAPAPPVITPLPPPPKTLNEEAVVIIHPFSPPDSVMHVIVANRGGIKSCVQRWSVRGHSAAALDLEIKLNIGISGRVKHVQQLDPRYRELDPCIKEVISRWVFPQSHEEYGVEFALTMRASPAD